MLKRRELLAATGAAMLGGVSAVRAEALDQVRFIYGFPAGSSGDIVARRVAERIGGSAYVKSVPVVENRSGAGGRIALEALRQAVPDGRTLVLTPYSCTAVYPHIYKNLSYQPARDLAPVSMAAMMHQGFGVGPLVPTSVRTLRDFVEWARKNPELAAYGSPGAGTVPHFVGALFALSAGVPMQHVPFRGSIPGVTDMAGGQIAAMSTPHGDLLPHYRSGRVRILATSGVQRSPFVPEVPTFTEQGFPDVVAEEWFAFFAPARTPAAVLDAANVAIGEALRQSSLSESIAMSGLIAQPSSRAALQASQDAEFARWKVLVDRIGFTAES